MLPPSEPQPTTEARGEVHSESISFQTDQQVKPSEGVSKQALCPLGYYPHSPARPLKMILSLFFHAISNTRCDSLRAQTNRNHQIVQRFQGMCPPLMTLNPRNVAG